MDDSIITTLSDETEVTIVTVTDDWCLAELDGQEGYVKADYVSVNGIPLVDPRGIITGDCVNVRSTPSTEGSIVAKVYAGNLVDLLEHIHGKSGAVEAAGGSAAVYVPHPQILPAATAKPALMWGFTSAMEISSTPPLVPPTR